MEKKYKIDWEIYSKDKINEAILDFREVSKIEFNNIELYIVWDTPGEIEEVFN